MITKSDIELSERLRKACAEKGITEPRFVAQDSYGEWWHYESTPYFKSIAWYASNNDGKKLANENQNKSCNETLMEFKNPTIEADKRYWRRDGEITDSLGRSIAITGGFYDAKGATHYKKNGTAHDDFVKIDMSERDLIAEYVESEPLAEVLNRTCAECGKLLA